MSCISNARFFCGCYYCVTLSAPTRVRNNCSVYFGFVQINSNLSTSDLLFNSFSSLPRWFMRLDMWVFDSDEINALSNAESTGFSAITMVENANGLRINGACIQMWLIDSFSENWNDNACSIFHLFISIKFKLNKINGKIIGIEEETEVDKKKQRKSKP